MSPPPRRKGTRDVRALTRNPPLGKAKVVVFDVGGVLIRWDDRWVMDDAARALGVPPRRLHELLHPYRPILQAGRIGIQGFWDLISKDLGRPVPREVRELWWRALEERARPRIEVITWADQLRRQGLRTSILSNTDPSHRRYFSRPWSRGFSPRLVSYELGAVKPDPQAFRQAERRLGVDGRSICLLDDVGKNVLAARRAGWNAHLFTGVTGARRYLERLGWVQGRS